VKRNKLPSKLYPHN